MGISILCRRLKSKKLSNHSRLFFPSFIFSQLADLGDLNGASREKEAWFPSFKISNTSYHVHRYLSFRYVQ